MNNESFELLLQENSKSIYRYFLRLGVSQTDAEDIVQETMYRAFICLDELHVDKFTPWLFRVAINYHYDLVRRKKRWELIPIETVQIIGTRALDEHIIKQEFQHEIQQLCNLLPQPYKHVLFLKYVYDFSYKEIANILAVKEETVKTMLYRARNQFRKIYRRKINETGSI